MLVTERFEICTEIIKGFEEGSLYEGTVVGYRDIYYQIQYKYEDEEELEHGQVYKYLKAQATKELGKRNCSFFNLGVPKIDSKSFGHNFLARPNDQCMTITFQNIGPQKKKCTITIQNKPQKLFGRAMQALRCKLSQV